MLYSLNISYLNVTFMDLKDIEFEVRARDSNMPSIPFNFPGRIHCDAPTEQPSNPITATSNPLNYSPPRGVTAAQSE